MDDCIFCKIVRGEIPTTFVAENEHAVAFNDRDPKAPVHVLVVSREHVSSIRDLTARAPQIAADCLLLANKVADSAGIADTGYRIITNSGADSGQSVFHLHFHVVGGRRLSFEV
jgi:histidine triad (HIT) family protein